MPAVGSDLATEWVDTGYTGTTTLYTITGLTNGQAYRVRIQAKNAAGNANWVEGSGTPVLPPASRRAHQSNHHCRPHHTDPQLDRAFGHRDRL